MKDLKNDKCKKSRRYIYICMFIFVIFLSINAVGVETISDINAFKQTIIRKSEWLKKQIDLMRPVQFEHERLVSSWDYVHKVIFSEQYGYPLDSKPGGIRNGRMFSLVDKMFYLLLKRGHIYELDERMEKFLNIKTGNCKSSKEACENIKALFIPALNVIFIKKNLSKTRFAFSLYHEVLHAFQYAYRFPLDIAGIIQLTEKKDKNGKSLLEKEDLFEYLNFYYEAQANWYELSLSKNDLWKNEQKRASVPSAMIKSFGAIATLGITLRIGNHRFNKILPLIDQVPSNQGHLYLGEKDTAFYFNELIVTKKDGLVLNLCNNFDLAFHKKFAEALEYAYFKNLDFLFQDGEVDQKVFKFLTDRFYERLIFSKSDYFSKCENLLSDVINGEMAPFIKWITISQDELSKCPIYEEYADESIRGKILNMYVDYRDSMFEFFPGSEGVRLDLNFNPVYLFHPQIEIVPLKKKK